MEQGPRQASSVRDIARERLGLAVIRAGQEETVLSILEAGDTLSVMPTGYGRSAIYPIAAVLLRGPTVVISPLIALQRDEVDLIAAQEVGGVALINAAVRQTEPIGLSLWLAGTAFMPLVGHFLSPALRGARAGGG
jgi:ATP-dependent DNA helicase RecQ